MSILPKKLYLSFFWFLPIIVATSTHQLKIYSIESYIPYIQSTILLISLLYLVVKKTIIIPKGILIIALILMVNMLLDDLSEYQFVLFIIAYSIVLNILFRRYSVELWSQYYFFCIIVSFIAIIDLVWFYFAGEFLISYRNPEILDFGIPRINGIFDEMSHMSFFIMPALTFAIVFNDKYKYLLSFALIINFSVQALLIFPFLLLFYSRKKIVLFPLKPFSIFLVIYFILLIFFFKDYLLSKMDGVVNYDHLINLELKKSISSVSILLSIDILKNIELYELLFGIGYFTYQDYLSQLIQSSELINYFHVIGVSDDPVAVGIVNFLIYFGLIQTFIMIFLIINLRKQSSDPWLYKLCLLICLISMLKNSHSISHLVHLLLLFGLPWASTKDHIQQISILNDKRSKSKI